MKRPTPKQLYPTLRSVDDVDCLNGLHLAILLQDMDKRLSELEKKVK